MRALLIALGLALAAAPVPAAAQDPTVQGSVTYTDGDAEMNAAIAEARRTLPVFWSYHGPDTQPGLKVMMTGNDGAILHVWFHDIRRVDGKVTGVLANDAPNLTLRPGDTAEIDPAKISDWSITIDGRLLGQFTTRVMLGSIPAKDAAYFRQILTKDPVKPDTPAKP